MWRKACPKCGGDVYEERYLEDAEIKCLQCGYVLPAVRAMALKQVPAAPRRTALAVAQRRAA